MSWLDGRLAARTSFGEQSVSLRWIYLHMIEETAQHRGHLDLLLDAVRREGLRDRGHVAL